MISAYQIIYEVLIVLAAAIVLGEVFEQLNLPSVAGELLAGLLVGPSLLHLVSSNDQTTAISSIALFFIIFHIGFETQSSTLRKNLVSAIVLSSTGFFIPLAIALAISTLLLPMPFSSDFVLALALAVPSISIVSVLVSQLRLGDKLSGQVVISSVVIIDIVSFIVLAALSRSASNTISTVIYTVLLVSAFSAVDYLLNRRPAVFREFLYGASRYFKREDIAYGILIVLGLLVAALFQLIGVSFMVGAFFAGLIIHDGIIGRRPFEMVSNTLARMNRAFFIPLFFGIAGVEAAIPYDDPRELLALAAVLVGCIIPCVLLSYFVSREVLKLPGKASRRIGIIIGGRGAVGIVIASVALSQNLINGQIYSLIIVGTLLVSILVPIFLRDRKKEIATVVQETKELTNEREKKSSSEKEISV